MKKLFGVIVFVCLAIGARAQNWTTVSASNITDLNQQKLAAGTLCFLGTDQNNIPISFQVGGGGQVLARPFCVAVTNGASAALTVPNPVNTSPTGIYYRVTVTDSSSGQPVLRYTQVTFSGGTFALDNYAPINLGNFASLSGNSVVGNLSVSGNLSVTGSLTQGALNVTGTATFTGSTTASNLNKWRYVDGVRFTTIQAAITDCQSDAACPGVQTLGGLVLSSTVAIPAHTTLILTPGLYSISGSLAFDLQGDGATLLGQGGTPLQVTSQPNSPVQISCTAAPCVRAMVPLASRSTSNSALNALHGIEIGNFGVNCNAASGKCLQLVGPYEAYVHDIGIFGFTGNGWWVDAGLSGDGGVADQIYLLEMNRIIAKPDNSATNSTLCGIDATYGEISLSSFSHIRCAGSTGTAKIGLYIKASTAQSNSSVHITLRDSYYGGTMGSGTGNYGIQLDTNATVYGGAGGIGGLVLDNVGLENYNGGGTGSVGIGGVNAGTPTGAGIGPIFTTNQPNGWATGIDTANLGPVFSFNQANGAPYLSNITGILPSQTAMTVNPQINATANSQTQKGFWESYTPHDKGFSSLTFQGHVINSTLASGGVSGNFSKATSLVVSDPNFGTTKQAIVSDDFVSSSANTASGGTVRLAVGDTIKFRNNANNNDLTLSIDGSDNLIGFGFKTGNTVEASGLKVDSSVSNDQGGLKHWRFGASCTTAATAGSTCTTTYTWNTAFANATYTPVCWGEAPIGSPVLSLSAAQIPASITVQVQAATAAASSFGQVYCIALHD